MANDPEDLGFTHGREVERKRREAHAARRDAVTTARCKFCGAAIYWATSSATGSRKCIDAAPDMSRGNCVLTLSRNEQGKDELIVDVFQNSAAAAAATEPGRKLYTSHHYTCEKKP